MNACGSAGKPNYRVGDEVEVTIVRDGQERQLTVRLAEQPQ